MRTRFLLSPGARLQRLQQQIAHKGADRAAALFVEKVFYQPCLGRRQHDIEFYGSLFHAGDHTKSYELRQFSSCEDRLP